VVNKHGCYLGPMHLGNRIAGHALTEGPTNPALLILGRVNNNGPVREKTLEMQRLGKRTHILRQKISQSEARSHSRRHTTGSQQAQPFHQSRIGARTSKRPQNQHQPQNLPQRSNHQLLTVRPVAEVKQPRAISHGRDP
jgi:hypothetical protein